MTSAKVAFYNNFSAASTVSHSAAIQMGHGQIPLTEIIELYDFIRVEGKEGKAVFEAALEPEVIHG